MYLKKWIEERMSLLLDDPVPSERGAYDAYLNVLNIINKSQNLKIKSVEDLPKEDCYCWVSWKGKKEIAKFTVPKYHLKPHFYLIEDKGGYPILDWQLIDSYTII